LCYQMKTLKLLLHTEAFDWTDRICNYCFMPWCNLVLCHPFYHKKGIIRFERVIVFFLRVGTFHSLNPSSEKLVNVFRSYFLWLLLSGVLMKRWKSCSSKVRSTGLGWGLPRNPTHMAWLVEAVLEPQAQRPRQEPRDHETMCQREGPAGTHSVECPKASFLQDLALKQGSGAGRTQQRGLWVHWRTEQLLGRRWR
jgi:hypothetical protein